MKIFAVVALTIFLFIQETTEQWEHLYQPKVRPVESAFLFILKNLLNFQKNTATLEKMICKSYPGSKVTDLKCTLKNIDRYHLKADISFNITEPIDNMYYHIEPYFKFTRYTRIAGHIWEDLCGWLAGKRTSFLSNYYMPILQKYSSFNHTCPYSGYTFIKFDNISMETFAFPQILPAGRYYLDIYVTESDRSKSKILFNYKLYNTVSDHRTEIL